MDDAKCQQNKKFSALTVLGKKLGAPMRTRHSVRSAAVGCKSLSSRKDGDSLPQAKSQAHDISVLVIRRMSCLLDAPVRVGVTSVGRFYAFRS